MEKFWIYFKKCGDDIRVILTFYGTVLTFFEDVNFKTAK